VAARTYHNDVDAKQHQLAAQAEAEALQRVLGRDIARQEGRPDLAGHRGDLHDPAGRPDQAGVRAQQRQEGLRARAAACVTCGAPGSRAAAS